eukprot:TRINITY_DN2108_c0_g1_i6.p1 TRINITY_DN2108_c0_g1~~TRINITY_DN2108_c0_g1_i6.p1  ORF type:complete len:333 (-),score=51.52 TRINITY_DN2108_c0_g1_i6:100-1098(-)
MWSYILMGTDRDLELSFKLLAEFVTTETNIVVSTERVHPDVVLKEQEGTCLVELIVENSSYVSFRDPSGTQHNFSATSLLPEHQHNWVLSPRLSYLLEIANMLRKYDISGLFEIHVTVDEPPNKNGYEDFHEICKSSPFRLKPVFIQLSRGNTPQQLMTSSYHTCSNISTVQNIGLEICRYLTLSGYHVIRLKIEVGLSSIGVPKTDRDAELRFRGNYFEFHVKLKLPKKGIDNVMLKDLGASHNAHLSRNVFKTSPGCTCGNSMGVDIACECEFEERFLTQRMYLVGSETAVEKCEAMCRDLESESFVLLAKMREYSLYDSNVGLDKGWLN